MKKAIFTTLVMALICGAFQTSWAAPRTSTSLATTTNLITNITKPDPDISLKFANSFHI